jgi:FKBP-type peptidyl-prolyl cis-trans isomerase 2
MNPGHSLLAEGEKVYIGSFYNRDPGVQMEGSTEAPKPRDMRRIVLAVLVVAIVLSAGLAVYIWYTGRGGTAGASSEEIISGDSVALNYIGRLPDGRVFDTSLVDVANNDVLYPKSLTFTHKANDSYGSFSMEAGKYGAGGTIKGFALGVIGMKKNETKVIEVSPEEGYAVDPAQLRTIKIEEDVLGMETFSQAQFAEAFGTIPILFHTYTHFFWGWPVVVVENTSGLVVVRHEPTAGMVVHPYGDPDAAELPSGWNVRVDAYDPDGFDGGGRITIVNEVSQSDVYNVKGIDFDGKTFVISAFDAANQTIQINKVDTTTGYNGEIAGRTLFFEVTIVSITRPSS